MTELQIYVLLRKAMQEAISLFADGRDYEARRIINNALALADKSKSNVS